MTNMTIKTLLVRSIAVCNKILNLVRKEKFQIKVLFFLNIMQCVTVKQKTRCHLASNCYMVYYESFHNQGQAPLYVKLKNILSEHAKRHTILESDVKKSFNENGFYFKIKPEAKAFSASGQPTIPDALHGSDVMAELKILPYAIQDKKIYGVSIEVLSLHQIKK